MADYTQADLERDLAEKFGLTKSQANEINNFCIQAKKDALERGETVQETGFITIAPYVKKGGLARNPKTGEQVGVPDKRWARARVSRALLEKWNED